MKFQYIKTKSQQIIKIGHNIMNIIPPVAAIPISLSSSQLDGNITSAVVDFETKLQRAVTLLAKQMIH